MEHPCTSPPGFRRRLGAEDDNVLRAKQTPQEWQEGCQINADLPALKEIMGAWTGDQARMPYLSSALTVVLRKPFAGEYAAALESPKCRSFRCVGVLGPNDRMTGLG
ncbi:hypothetical protein IMZ48_30890 [Candidatus Bathyarchaeota archaeon]|nr:hypothetical protein [Candidatus Bathyarchaeota archaeon]